MSTRGGGNRGTRAGRWLLLSAVVGTAVAALSPAAAADASRMDAVAPGPTAGPVAPEAASEMSTLPTPAGPPVMSLVLVRDGT